MDLYFVEIPKTDGHEQFGLRPAILFSKPLKEISIIIPFTSNILALKFPYTFKIEPTLENGLTSPSILLGFQIRAIDSKRLKKKIGSIEANMANEISKLIQKMLFS